MPRQGQAKGTPARRAEFIEYLRNVGPGHFCISWPWSTMRGQYIYIHVNGEKIRAHRWVYEQVNGVVLDRAHEPGAIGPVVMHTCDNRACVRPSHLVLGTQLENLQDAAAKGRMDGDARRKLSDNDVILIRRLNGEGHSQSAIARAFGVSVAAVHLIVHNKTRTGRPHGNQKLTDDQRSEIRRLVSFGARQTDVARSYGVTPTTINKIVNDRPR